MPINSKAIRTKLIDYRGSRTQEQMADIYKVSFKTWNSWENGRSSPRPPLMLRLEKDSGIPMEELFSDVFYK